MVRPINYTWEQASEVVNVPVIQLRHAARDGALKVNRIGKHVRISDWALREFIKNKEEVAAEIGYEALTRDFTARRFPDKQQEQVIGGGE